MLTTIKNLRKSIAATTVGVLAIIPAFSQTQVTFNYTGAVQTWTVPACVTSIDIEAAGGEGGGSQGGNGAVVTGTIPVTPGQTLEIYVGGSGACPGGGFNGGGNGSTTSNYNAGCGGGGATDIRVNPYNLGDRLLVAAGGGGTGGGTTNAVGGAGGCNTGTNGANSWGNGGGGGTQSAGGFAGGPWGGGNWGQAGSLGQGGNGATDPCYNYGPGGAGGGGYYGGGGAGSDCYPWPSLGGGGGGGGSSLVPGGGGCTANSNTGDGYLIITYVPAAPVGGTATADPDPICSGDNTTLTLTGYVGTIQWQSAPSSAGPWTDIPGATTDVYPLTLNTGDDACFQAVVTSCGTTDVSNVACVTVNPIPDVTNPGNQLICANTNTTDIFFVGAVPGTSYDWNNSDPSIGLAASGNGDIPAFMGLNAGTTPVTATIDVTPSANGCTGTTEIFTITVNHEPLAGADNMDELCNSPGTSIDMNTLVSGNNLPGVWAETTSSGMFDPATGIFDVSNLTAGNYTFTYTVAGLAPCPDDIADFTITVQQAVTAGADNGTIKCNDAGTIVDMNLLLNGNDPGVWAETTGSGQFNIGTGIFDVSGLPGGVYSFTYTVAAVAPCVTDVANFNITVNQIPPVNAGVDISVCDGTPVTLSATGAGGGGYYNWTGGVTNNVSFIQPLGTQTYVVVGTDANGCDNVDSIVVTVNPVPAILFSADTLLGCVGQVVQFTNMSSPAGDNCVWNFGNGQIASGCNGAGITYLQAGVFDVTFTATTNEGCTNTDTYYQYITIEEWPQPFFTYSPPTLQVGSTEATFENASLYSDWYEWDFGDLTAISTEEEPTHTFPDVGNANYTVTLTAFSYAGCSASTQVVVYVEDPPIYYVPNAFTPDGDEFNQYFSPVFTAGFDIYDYHFMVFNKWGEIVFESYDASIGWDGTYGSKGLVEDGTYVWRIEFGEASTDARHKVHGHVTVLK